MRVCMLALAKHREPSAKELASGDVLQQRIRPLAFKTQKANAGAWEMDKQCHDVLGDMQRDQVKLSKL